jgi:hypothetical protein
VTWHTTSGPLRGIDHASRRYSPGNGRMAPLLAGTEKNPWPCAFFDNTIRNAKSTNNLITMQRSSLYSMPAGYWELRIFPCLFASLNRFLFMISMIPTATGITMVRMFMIDLFDLPIVTHNCWDDFLSWGWDSNTVRAVLDGELRIHAPFRYVQWVPNSARLHVSASPPFNPAVNILVLHITIMD